LRYGPGSSKFGRGEGRDGELELVFNNVPTYQNPKTPSLDTTAQGEATEDAASSSAHPFEARILEHWPSNLDPAVRDEILSHFNGRVRLRTRMLSCRLLDFQPKALQRPLAVLAAARRLLSRSLKLNERWAGPN
jgi:hypothetical protein